jgi:hypothetical protein
MTLQEQAAERDVQVPSAKTLAIYGLTANGWIRLLKAQGWKCPICLKSHKRWNTDHDHIPGWKKLPSKERALHVRGILCWYCNHKVVGDKRDSVTMQRVADYLRAHEERRRA